MADNIEVVDGKACAKRLKAIAKGVRTGIAKYAKSCDDALMHIVDVGQPLNTAKALCKHGEWLEWLKRSCNLSPGHARRYMEAADKYAKLPPNEARALRLMSPRRFLAYVPDGANQDEPAAVEGHDDHDANEPSSLPRLGGAVQDAEQEVDARTDGEEAPGPDGIPAVEPTPSQAGRENKSKCDAMTLYAGDAAWTLNDLKSLKTADVERLTRVRQHRSLDKTDEKLCKSIDRLISRHGDAIVAATANCAGVGRAGELLGEKDPAFVIAAVLARLQRRIETPPKATAGAGSKTKRNGA